MLLNVYNECRTSSHKNIAEPWHADEALVQPVWLASSQLLGLADAGRSCLEVPTIMTETTSIYSVSIPRLRAVCGGGDLTIAELACARSSSLRPLPTDYRVGPRIRVSWKSEIFLNEMPISKTELIEELKHPKWNGTMLYELLEDSPKGLALQGEFNEIGSFSAFLHDHADLRQFCGLYCVSRHDTLEDIRKTADSLLEPIAPEEFVRDLLNGKRRFRHRGREYGHALESICDCIGTNHGLLGTDRLRSLEIKTPLIKIGSPVRLPKIEDEPAICYLDEEDLDREHNRLSKFKFSSDPSLLPIQKRYKAIIEHSTNNERGIVTFYY